jgi:hypothetical protein
VSLLRKRTLANVPRVITRSLPRRDPKELKTELDRWGLFGEYEDRFFSLFGK